MPLVYALSVSHEIEKIGSYAGFAAIIGLAVLALLYFSQAREVKRLREWAGRSPERAQELEARVVEQAELARQAATERRVVAQPQPKPAAAPAPAAATPAPAPAKPPVLTPAGTPAPIPAMAVAAQAALAAKAKPAEQPVAAPPTPTTAPPATPAAVPSEDGKAVPASPATAPATVAGGAVPVAPARQAPETNGSPEEPPTVIPPPPVATPAPEPVAARAAAVRAERPSATIPPRRPAEPPRRTRDDGGDGRGWGTIAVVVATLAVVAGGAFLLINQLGGDDSPKQPNTPGQVDTGDSTQTSSTKTKSDKPVSRGDVVVAVLNGTTFTGLASDIAGRLENAGFKKGAVTNAGDQTHSATLIQYAPGFEKQARDIGKILKVADAVERLDSSTKAIACPPGECPTAQKPAPDVVVTVGADRTN
jgi:hypothetical protein